ncbi:MAG: agmatine deiminase family protein [Candidatus Tectomicrobia bacterium]
MRPEPPVAHGYRMPAEWETHAATWLAWPHNTDTWPDQLVQVQMIYGHIITALQAREAVHLLVNDASTAARVRHLLALPHLDQPHLTLHQLPTADAWLRDSGPIFLTSMAASVPPLALVDWCFTAWGGKYEELMIDDHLPQHMARILGLPCFRPGIVLEGGSIDVNGRGSCLTTEQCLLHPNRNPHLKRADIEQALYDYLGVHHVIWLGQGIVGDDTDGHVDDIARFVNPTTVVCALTDDPQEVNYAVLQDNYRRLQAATDQDGHPLQVIPLPLPSQVGFPTELLPASYANFYIGNGVVLVPIYNHPHDQVALTILQDVFPHRRVIGIPCEPLVQGLGAIHCITQQQPVTTAMP